MLHFSQPVIWSYLSVRHTPSLSTPWADQGNQACQPQMNAENLTPEPIEDELEDLTPEQIEDQIIGLALMDNWQSQEIVALWQDDEFSEVTDGEELEW